MASHSSYAKYMDKRHTCPSDLVKMKVHRGDGRSYSCPIVWGFHNINVCMYTCNRCLLDRFLCMDMLGWIYLENRRVRLPRFGEMLSCTELYSVIRRKRLLSTDSFNEKICFHQDIKHYIVFLFTLRLGPTTDSLPSHCTYKLLCRQFPFKLGAQWVGVLFWTRRSAYRDGNTATKQMEQSCGVLKMWLFPSYI